MKNGTCILLICVAGQVFAQVDGKALETAREKLSALDSSEMASLCIRPDSAPLQATGKLNLATPWSFNAKPTAKLPCQAALAATWNTGLCRQYAQAMASEAFRQKQNALLTPCANVYRDDGATVAADCFGEDPLLASKMAAAEVAALQDAGICPCVYRLRKSGDEDGRAFNEIDLAPWRAAIKDAGAWAVMADEDKYVLKGILRERWHYDGMLIVDWQQSAVPVKTLEQMTLRTLYTLARANAFDSSRKTRHDAAGPAATRSAALAVAEEAITLLKNDHALLPLNAKKTGNLLIIGDTAKKKTAEGKSASIYDAIAKYMKANAPDAKVKLAPLTAYDTCSSTHEIPHDAIVTTNAEGKATWEVEWFDYVNEPQEISNAHGFCGRAHMKHGEPWPARGEDAPLLFTIRFSALVKAPESGEFVLSCHAPNARSLKIVIDGTAAAEGQGGEISCLAHMEKDVPYAIAIVYNGHSTDAEMDFGWRRPSEYNGFDDLIQDVNAADAVVIVPASEGKKKTAGDEAIAKLLELKPKNTVVACCTPAPLELPWASKCTTLLQVPPCGEAQGEAFANILFGKTQPSGKTIHTWPKKPSDAPSSKRGAFTGYRWYDKEKIEPLFPFGHGLGYTKFDYDMDHADVTEAPEQGKWKVSIPVKNIGRSPGKEALELYVLYPAALPGEERPARELKGFAKTRLLQPGESQTLSIELATRDLAMWDEFGSCFNLEPGDYSLLVGASAQDIRAKAKITVREKHVFDD